MSAYEVTPELSVAMSEYRRVFNDGFPASFVGKTTEGRIARIKECIAANTPVPESEYEHFARSLIVT